MAKIHVPRMSTISKSSAAYATAGLANSQDEPGSASTRKPVLSRMKCYTNLDNLAGLRGLECCGRWWVREMSEASWCVSCGSGAVLHF